MDTKLILQIFSFFIILLSIYSSYFIILSRCRIKRLSKFALDNKEDFSIENSIAKTINKISKILKKLIIFNSIGTSYDKYISKYSIFIEGMDILSLKFITSIISMFIYIFGCAFNKLDFNTTYLLVFFIIGFITPSIYYRLKFKKHKEILEDDITRAIIIINNCLKANKSIEQALNEVIERINGPIEIEFRKVIYDTKLGLTLSESMMRMYKRTKIKIIKDISIYLSLFNKNGINIINIFDQLENKLVEEQKLKLELISIKKTNILYYILFMFIPLLVLIILLLNNDSYLNLFTTKYAPLLIIFLSTLYILYIYIIAKMVRRKY